MAELPRSKQMCARERFLVRRCPGEISVGKKLCKSIFWPGLSAGNPELVIGEQIRSATAFRFDVNRLARLEASARRFLRDHARLFD